MYIPQNGEKMVIFRNIYFHRFSGSKLTPENATSRFHTVFGSRDTDFRSFVAKKVIKNNIKMLKMAENGNTFL